MSRFGILISSVLLVLGLFSLESLEKVDKSVYIIATIALSFFLPLLLSKIKSPSFGFVTSLKLIGKCMFCRRELRLSFAYLIRIRVGKDHYLLVKNAKKKEKNLANKYQPVGGVFHLYNKSFLEKEFSLLPDNMKNSDRQDLRVRMSKPFKIFAFLDWFQKGEEREVAPYREFYEELIKAGVLPIELFANVQFEKKKTKHIKVVWSKYNKINEYKLFEIYEARLTEEQECYIQKVAKKEDKEIKLVTCGDIEKYSGKDMPGEDFGIAEQTVYII